jgi:hypothetical protein
MPAFTWTANYIDGSKLYQVDPVTGKESSSEHIDRSKVISLDLCCDGKPFLVQHLESGQRLIYRRRVAQPAGRAPIIVHLIGWQKTIHGESVQNINVVFEADGHIESVGRFMDNHPWAYSPTWVAADEQPVTSTVTVAH